jgi:Ca2+-binding RTX toxin-like protein
MLRFVADLTKSLLKNSYKPARRKSAESKSSYENLEARQLLASISFNAANGFVTLTGDAADETGTATQVGANYVFTLTGVMSETYSISDVTDIFFRGNDGNDTFTNFTGLPMTAQGGAGDDILNGGSGFDRLVGGAGNDTLKGNAGNDVIVAGEGDDILEGNAGEDNLLGQGGDDQLFGGSGNDMLSGGDGDNLADGGSGDDFIGTGSGSDTIFGGDGIDTVVGGAGVDVVFGGNGNDFIYGGDGNDRLIGQDGDDTIAGNNGADFINGGNDNDLLLGHEGADTILAGFGNDRVFGGSDNDRLFGEDGDDVIGGGAGDDLADGGNGADTVYGEDGDDLIRGEAGIDNLFGQEGKDLIFGGSGVDLLNGGSGADELHGGLGNDRLVGGAGNDNLYGEAGADELFGGDGNDGLIGGSDAVDIMAGNAGKDRFLFVGNDNILDFNQPFDAKIEFRNGTSSWTNKEIEVIDEGLFRLHDTVGNVRILREAVTSEPIVFVKDLTIPVPVDNRLAVNELVTTTTNVFNPVTLELEKVVTTVREITIADWDESVTDQDRADAQAEVDAAGSGDVGAIALAKAEARNTARTDEVPRELAYVWASEEAVVAVISSQGDYWNSFLRVSGWTQTRPDPIGFFDTSGDAMWWFLQTSAFAEADSTQNPEADFATIWKFKMQQLYAEPTDVVVRPELESKLERVDDLFSRLSVF